jgi:DivIVA domain-containing protein
MEQRTLTPAEVRSVTFDKAPLGKRGYDEKQVDAFLDRVEATLTGTDQLSSEDVRAVVFADAPLIRRGYHEDQVDDFLDVIVMALELRERRPAKVPAPPGTPPPRRQPPVTEQAERMAYATPPPVNVFEPPPVNVFSPPPASAFEPPAATTQPLHASDDDLPPSMSLPIPPAPPGARGYRPRDVEQLAMLLRAAATGLDGPTSAEVEAAPLGRTVFDGQGYRAEVVEHLRIAWIEELRYREGRPRG